MGEGKVWIATIRDRKSVVDVVTLGFSSDPMTRWTLPNPAQYLAVMPEIADAFGGKAFEHGSVYCVDDFSGAALWLPPGIEPDSERLGALIARHAPAPVLEDVGGVLEQMAAYHPHEPHWYLPLIAVDPACQGRGLGGALLKRALARCDADRLPAYLESSNPRNITLYQRNGFEILGRIQAGSSPVVTPMLRTSR
ncbi:MAG TPA: N-acetyltransferase [Vicinamibacterales bacterium]|nr:N-acetyltransferase [Vicinamibacterales bacterium]